MRDLHRVLSGPGYARRLVAEARRAGVEIRSRTQVTGWSAGGALEVTSPTRPRCRAERGGGAGGGMP